MVTMRRDGSACDRPNSRSSSRVAATTLATTSGLNCVRVRVQRAPPPPSFAPFPILVVSWVCRRALVESGRRRTTAARRRGLRALPDCSCCGEDLRTQRGGARRRWQTRRQRWWRTRRRQHFGATSAQRVQCRARLAAALFRCRCPSMRPATVRAPATAVALVRCPACRAPAAPWTAAVPLQAAGAPTKRWMHLRPLRRDGMWCV